MRPLEELERRLGSVYFNRILPGLVEQLELQTFYKDANVTAEAARWFDTCLREQGGFSSVEEYRKWLNPPVDYDFGRP